MAMVIRETSLKQQLLRAQIEPHFLYNALSFLQSLIRRTETEKAIGYLNSLAKLMRFNFENASKSFVALNSEIEALKNYLHLQNLYHPGKFVYTIDVYEGFEEEELLIPPMLLQPFVENAINHGFSQIDYIGMIRIKVERQPSTLRVTIEDNGRGIRDAVDKNEVHSSAINQERLSILARQTGKPARLSIINKSTVGNENGVIVNIEIPIQNETILKKISAY
jgi:LytS/YehU family sensor histidine kinase